MDERERVADLAVLERAEPAGLCGWIGLDPGADRLDHEDVAEAGDDRFAAGSELLRLGGHQPQRALHPIELGRAGWLDVADRRQDLDEVAGGGMVETNGSADQHGARAAPAMAEDLIAVADLLTLELENSGRGSSGLAAQHVPLAVRHEAEIAGLQHGGAGLAGLEPDASRGDHVEPDVARHRHHRKSPRLRQLGAAIEGAVHAQEMQRLAERIRWRPGIAHRHAGSIGQASTAMDDQA